MLKINPDESLHSFIFRKIMTFDNSSFCCIVGKLGRWFARPLIPENLHFLFEDESDEDLLNALRRSWGDETELTIYSNPVLHINLLNNIFRSNPVVSLSPRVYIPVAFCPECLKESINIYGYGYFKSNWLKGVNCEKHGVKLEILNDLRFKHAVEKIKLIMCGSEKSICTDRQDDRYLPSRQIITPDSGVALKLPEVSGFSGFIMYCLLLEFHSSACKYLIEIINSKKTAYAERSTLVYFRSAVRFFWYHKRHSYIKLQSMFENMEKNYPDMFNRFILNHSLLNEVKYGFRCSDSFSINILKNKKSNCSKCMFSFKTSKCPKNMLIKVWEL